MASRRAQICINIFKFAQSLKKKAMNGLKCSFCFLLLPYVISLMICKSGFSASSAIGFVRGLMIAQNDRCTRLKGGRGAIPSAPLRKCIENVM